MPINKYEKTISQGVGKATGVTNDDFSTIKDVTASLDSTGDLKYTTNLVFQQVTSELNCSSAFSEAMPQPTG